MTTSRPLRADAARNRDSILTAARETFEHEGVLAPLDTIAVRAGVGNATLYRNFPTRDDLLAAVMQNSIHAAVSDAAALARDLPPRQALSEWLITLAWRLRIWHDLPYCLATAQQQPDSAMNATAGVLVTETAALLERAKAAGGILENITADQVFELVTTLSWGIDRFGDDEPSARQRTQLATAGIFAHATPENVGRDVPEV